jgi:hypothetical protein
MKFSEWIKIKEATQPQMGQNVVGAIKTAGVDPQDKIIANFVADAVNDKTGNLKNVSQKGVKAAAVLRQQAVKKAQSGDAVGAFKDAAKASQLTQVAMSVSK